jgi:hypothetical protein
VAMVANKYFRAWDSTGREEGRVEFQEFLGERRCCGFRM